MKKNRRSHGRGPWSHYPCLMSRPGYLTGEFDTDADSRSPHDSERNE